MPPFPSLVLFDGDHDAMTKRPFRDFLVVGLTLGV